MTDSLNAGFGKFVPGFDFLQNLAKGTSEAVPQMPNLANWIAPTLNVEELEKRITELKAVHFWLEQNSKALGATVQALEVQKMTLATLKGMNFNFADMANALKLKAADTVASSVQSVTEKAAATAKSLSDAAEEAEEVAKKVSKAAKPVAATAAAGLVDPMQLWGSLTQQFQHIAASALKDAAKSMPSASSSAGNAATKAATKSKPAAKSGSKTPAKTTAKKAAKKTAAAKR
jgi:hypothetical protein